MGKKKKKEDNSFKYVLVIMAFLWIILLIGILANKPYNDRHKSDYVPREGAAVERKTITIISNLK